MLIKLFICFFIFKVVVAQMNGEFWWLNDELLKLYKVEPPQPKFEDIGEFDTDESAKIVFRDAFDDMKKEETLSDTTTEKPKDIAAIIHFRDDSKLINQVEFVNKSETSVTPNNRIDTVGNIKQETNNYKDVFNFVFPDEAASYKTDKNKNDNQAHASKSESFVKDNVNKSENFNNRILINTEEGVLLSENICTYMKESECSHCNGFPYTTEKQLNFLKSAINAENVCCILPLTKPKSSKIRFPGNYNYNRIKRSNNNNMSLALKQRKNLMEKKYGTQTISTVTQKIVTPEDEYIDPYINIKNTYFKPKDYETESAQQENSDYIFNDYYAAELPKPSLVGLYSDHSPPDWSFVYPNKGSSYNDESVEEEIPSFGYSTIDPRQDSGEKMLQSESSIDEDYDDYTEVMEPLFKNCGRTKDNDIYNCDSTLGESTKGAHPWLLLVTLSKRRQSILCYATLIHPRAAVTTADCTYEMKGEITIVAGAWDLREEKREHLQYRKPLVRAHQQYTPGKLDYNIALLYWRRPLRLDSHVQPACLSDDTANDCIFVGWGGYDQAVRQRPRWQRASILSSQDCAEKMSNEQEFDLPIDTFCASVDSKTTVTGPGGPLLCRTNNIFSLVGLSVWRNHVVVLTRSREWAIRAMASLRNN
ncbi:PREDICTED: limulus clotting factor C-like isoform X3 [Papilio polytes]|uniref:limulus clotting factor C-like isoform X3 n=1 Tax=Papilio polytes TaxID=76194 RepID=UPI0006767C10|nr:PREDICTED: limulus clotting factor C-like isoform X3 [Papilio polytes]